MDSFAIHRHTGVITVNKDLRRKKTTNFIDVKNKGNSVNRQRRDLNNDIQIDGTESSDNGENIDDENIEDIRFKIRADNGPNTTVVTTNITVRVNYTCEGCVIYTLEEEKKVMKGATTTIVVVASIAVFLIILFLLCMAYFLKKKGCFQRGNRPAAGFCTTKKEKGLCNSVERELLNSGASSFDRLQQHFYNGEHTAEKSHVSSETGLLPDGSGTGRSVSAADKASTYSFGIYHEQGKPESEIHRLQDTLSEMTLIKELEDDSVFGYSSGKLKSEPTKSMISRSTQESSLYSLSSNAVHRNNFNFVPTRPNKQVIAAKRTDSHESLKDFMEEGGGEAAGGIDVGNLLYAKLAEVDADERDAIMESVRPFQEEGALSYGGSFSTIIGSEEDFNNYPSYRNNWKPKYRSTTNSVFSEIVGRASGPPVQPRGRPPPVNYNYNQKDVIVNSSVAKQQPHSDVNKNNRLRLSEPAKNIKASPHLAAPSQPILTAPPLDIPLQVLNSGRTSMLSSVTSLPRLPQDIQSTYTSGALSPNFTPAMTPLVFRSPSVSSIGTNQDEFSSSLNQNTKIGGVGRTRTNFDVGFSSLRRSDSRVSQLSRITLSDLDISDAEMEL